MQKIFIGILMTFILAGGWFLPQASAADEASGHSHGTEHQMTMPMDGGMQMTHDGGPKEASSEMTEGNHQHEEHSEGHPEGHVHDERTTGKPGIGPNWPLIYTFLAFNATVLIIAGIMKFKKKKVIPNGIKN